MEPLAVVNDSDLFKDGRLGFGACGELAAMPQLPLVAAPEAFPRRIVVGVAGAAHAGDAARLREALAIILAGVLSAAIEVMQEPAAEHPMIHGGTLKGVVVTFIFGDGLIGIHACRP